MSSPFINDLQENLKMIKERIDSYVVLLEEAQQELLEIPISQRKTQKYKTKSAIVSQRYEDLQGFRKEKLKIEQEIKDEQKQR